MGAIRGPDVTTPTATSTGGNDDFGGRPVDVVFKYAGVNGNGDPGVIDPPTNAYRMTRDFNVLSAINRHPTRVAVGSYALSCGPTAYNCLSPNDTYREYLLEYDGQPNHYDWSSGNGKLALAASDDVFAILWGGGNTNVIRNFSNIDDHGWLAGKIKAYYTNPMPVAVHY